MVIASVVGVGALVVLAVIGGAVGIVLFLRKNPNKAAAVEGAIKKL